MGAEEVEPEPQVGDRLGKYLLREKLGEGGMGVVFSAVHEVLGREVAIKLLRPQFARNEQLMARFQREAEAVSRIGHPNIVAVYDFGHSDDGSLFYVMERIRGESLRRRLDRGPALDDDALLALFAPMCRALGAAHAVGVVHRDLKPDNVLLQARADGLPHVKVLDFGVAKVLETENNDVRLTKAGMIIGTPTYMAPEQIAAAANVDGRADLYSLGAILYVCLTGRAPFTGDPMAVLVGHMREAAPAPSAVGVIRPTPPALEAMVLRALAKEPAGRPQDAATFLAELAQALGRPTARLTTSTPPIGVPVTPFNGLTTPAPGAPTVQASHLTPASPSPAGSAAPLPPGRRRALVIGLGAAAGLAAVVAIVGLPRARPTPPLAATPPVAAEPSRAEALVAAALDGAAEERRTVLETLGELGQARALPAIASALGDDNPEVRRAAAVAAAGAGPRGDATLLAALDGAAQRSGGAVAVEIAAARLHLGDTAAVDLLTRALEAPDPALRLRAAVELAEAGRLAAPRLRAALGAAPPTVRRPLRLAALVALRRLGDRALAGEIDRALAGSDLDAKLDAALLLAQAGEPKARAALADMVEHAANGDQRRDARAALAALGDGDALGALAAELRGHVAADRIAAAHALASLGRVPAAAASARAALAPLIDDDVAELRLVAAAALSMLPSDRRAP